MQVLKCVDICIIGVEFGLSNWSIQTLGIAYNKQSGKLQTVLMVSG